MTDPSRISPFTDARTPIDRKTGETTLSVVALDLNSKSPRVVLDPSTMTSKDLRVTLVAEFSPDGGKTWVRAESTHCGGREVYEDFINDLGEPARRPVFDKDGAVIREDGTPVNRDGVPLEFWLAFQLHTEQLADMPLFRGSVIATRGELTTTATVRA